MPTMTHPETGASFDCPDRQVGTWESAGWRVHEEQPVEEPRRRGKRTEEPSDQAPTGDNTEE